MPQCQAINCKNKQQKGGKSFFHIPDPRKSPKKVNRALCKKWIDLLRNDKLDINNFVSNRGRVVCEDHFLPESFTDPYSNAVAASLNFKPTRKSLKPGALPVLVDHQPRREKTRQSTTSLMKKRQDAQLNHILIVVGATAATICSHGGEIYILLLVLGALGAIGGAVSLFMDCTGKLSKALACLVLWHCFFGLCILLVVLENPRKIIHQIGITELTIYSSSLAVHIVLCILEAIFILKDNKNIGLTQKSTYGKDEIEYQGLV